MPNSQIHNPNQSHRLAWLQEALQESQCGLRDDDESSIGDGDAVIYVEAVEDEEEVRPQGHRLTNARVERYRAKRRQEKIRKAQREFLKSTIAAHRRQHPPWWLRLWHALVGQGSSAFIVPEKPQLTEYE
jgi:hypothetical protein